MIVPHYLKKLARNYHFLLYTLFFLATSAQHKVIEFSDIKNWPSLHFPSLTPDGQYAAFMIKSDADQASRLCIRSFHTSETFDVENVTSFSFAMDSRHLVYTKQGGNGIIIINLKTQKKRQVDSVLSYQFFQDKPNDWLVIRKLGSSSKMVALNLRTGKLSQYDSISKIHLFLRGCELIVEEKKETVDGPTIELRYINLENRTHRTVWTGKAIHSFDFNEKTFLFSTSNKDLLGNDCIDVYAITGHDVNHLYRKQQDSMDLTVDRMQGPSNDGKFLLFYARNPSEPSTAYRKDTSYPNVRIWSYLDQQLKTVREQNTGSIRSYLYAMALADGTIHRIEQPNEEATEIDSMRYLIRQRNGDCYIGEAGWNKACATKYYILSKVDYKKTHIPELDNQNAFLSPKNKYLLYYNSKLKSYCIYNIANSSSYPISGNIEGATWDSRSNKGVLRRVAGWLPDDAGVMLYDSYDLYLFDPARKNVGRCLTEGIGERTKTVFALTFDESVVRFFDSGNQILLTAFNTSNKNNGFFLTTLSGNVTELIMGPYIYDVSQVKSGTDFPPAECSFMPKKAQFANVYIVKRTAAAEFGNLYMTRDFKRFKKISDLHPEKGFNWYSSELHSWPAADSTIIQGILYKPLNFDSTKKYPVIFHYYDRKSDGLNAYITPDALYYGCSINIPYYVSREYLIALVDIHFKTGYTGQSALQSLESAASYFSRFKYIDSTRFGIEGFSFGGYLTYYLVSHTKIFSAASSGAGITDLISQSGTLGRNIYPQHELSQLRVGSLLWERPDLFVENSPVMASANIETPLLMMNNTHDGAVDIRQSIELFTALRRQAKKVWLLEYLEGDHGVSGEGAVDYCVRQQQFFDHYLKGKPMPEWMTKEN